MFNHHYYYNNEQSAQMRAEDFGRLVSCNVTYMAKTIEVLPAFYIHVSRCHVHGVLVVVVVATIVLIVIQK